MQAAAIDVTGRRPMGQLTEGIFAAAIFAVVLIFGINASGPHPEYLVPVCLNGETTDTWSDWAEYQMFLHKGHCGNCGTPVDCPPMSKEWKKKMAQYPIKVCLVGSGMAGEDMSTTVERHEIEIYFERYPGSYCGTCGSEVECPK